MPTYDVFGVKKKNSIMFDTWGHLYPQPCSKHKGRIIIAHGCYGGSTILDYKFGDLCGSPQLAEIIRTSLDIFDFKTDAGLYQLDCTVWFFKHCHDMYLGQPIGKIIKPRLTLLQEVRL